MAADAAAVVHPAVEGMDKSTPSPSSLSVSNPSAHFPHLAPLTLPRWIPSAPTPSVALTSSPVLPSHVKTSRSFAGLILVDSKQQLKRGSAASPPSGRLPCHSHGTIAVDLQHRRLPAVPSTSTTTLTMVDP
ncbi:uncharacterized protein LOC119341700 isoform X2 [Triticum dicoccoides]|uniref:uncharacterized protein LOC119341700 isoform X2 n=1 Tax=Triticum dicoccoides TaxID=85692 RepID=UPI0018913350|nr:uncharacterized protein LOC119341700 isoform X2 [Triticum dicoccoides]